MKITPVAGQARRTTRRSAARTDRETGRRRRGGLHHVGDGTDVRVKTSPASSRASVRRVPAARARHPSPPCADGLGSSATPGLELEVIGSLVAPGREHNGLGREAIHPRRRDCGLADAGLSLDHDCDRDTIVRAKERVIKDAQLFVAARADWRSPLRASGSWISRYTTTTPGTARPLSTTATCAAAVASDGDVPQVAVFEPCAHSLIHRER